MSHITPIDYETASEAVRAEHDREVQLRGRMTNMKRTLLHSPVAHRQHTAWAPQGRRAPRAWPVAWAAS
ncbi:MAG: hypothetical protein J0H91_02795, partial [Rhodospirillales bacterium]|nr:hypothetical protein [Rhodospirillales bacterium]